MTIVGGLSLDGGIPPMHGVLPIAVAARKSQRPALIFPPPISPKPASFQTCPCSRWRRSSTPSAFFNPAPGIGLRPAPHRGRRGRHRRSLRRLRTAPSRARSKLPPLVRTICCSRERPGVGKTMLARRAAGLAPSAGIRRSPDGDVNSLNRRVLRRAPDSCARGHSGRRTTRVRTWRWWAEASPRPGEISLAHCGVLFLDELPEFTRRVRNAATAARTRRRSRGTREPECHVPRPGDAGGRHESVPVRFPRGTRAGRHCPPAIVDRYQRRLSGPLRDRFDIGVEVQAVPWLEIAARRRRAEPTAPHARVESARRVQLDRQGQLNSQLKGRILRAHVTLDRTSHRLMGTAVTRFGPSAWGVTRVLRVARTIADLSGEAKLRSHHVAEALQFRVPERSAGSCAD